MLCYSNSKQLKNNSSFFLLNLISINYAQQSTNIVLKLCLCDRNSSVLRPSLHGESSVKQS
jgi:hypothetical protein